MSSCFIYSFRRFSFILFISFAYLLGSAAFFDAGADIVKLLKTASSKSASRDIDSVSLARYKELEQSSHLWPIQTFLLGEVYRLRGDNAEAIENYQVLVKWAASNPYGDRTGGSGIAMIALWRWLQSYDSNETTLIIDCYDKLKDTFFAKGMFHIEDYGYFLSSLPQIEEDIKLRIAGAALAAEKRDKARTYFLDYLKISNQGWLNSMGEELMREVLKEANPEEVKIAWAKRLYQLRQYDKAISIIENLKRSSSAPLRAEAGLYEAKIHQSLRKPDAAELFGNVYMEAEDMAIKEEALYNRGMVYARKGNIAKSRSDLLKLTKEFPQGRFHDDALFYLANYYKNTGNINKSLEYFERLRTYQGPNNKIDSAHFYPAIFLYKRGQKKEALDILKALMTKRPDGPLKINALFWLGRISAEIGNSDQARHYYEQAIKEMPYHYYAVRARMHLSAGEQAKTRLWPDQKTETQLRNEFKKSFVDNNLEVNTPYHRRIQEALSTGLYRESFVSEQKLGHQYPSIRYESLSFKKIDGPYFAGLVVVESLRQDAFAARDADKSAKNSLQLAEAVSSVKDWPLTLILTRQHVIDEKPLNQEPQQDKRFLSTAYPTVYKSELIAEGKRYDVEPELLYSVMRQESLFSNLALSRMSALGLFQFIPSTFNTLNRRWGLLKNSGAKNREEFLTDPKNSISLGAKWFRQELLNRYRNRGEIGVLFALMDHNAGYPAVKNWIRLWKSEGTYGDIEYMIETVRFVETRYFARNVLANYYISRSSGIFK